MWPSITGGLSGAAVQDIILCPDLKTNKQPPQKQTKTKPNKQKTTKNPKQNRNPKKSE